MIFAALGDIAGDVSALRCAFDAIDDLGILTIVATGNVAAGAGDPNATVALLRDRSVPCALGEDDRLLLRFQRKQRQLKDRIPEEQWDRLAKAHAAITSENLEYLRNLHRLVRLEMDGVQVHVCHGSPSSPGEILSPETPFVRLQRHREAEAPDILVCGGHAEPWEMSVDGTVFIGPGLLRSSPTEAGFVTVNTEATHETMTAHTTPCE